MKSFLLFLVTNIVAYGSAQENIVVKVQQLVGCGDDCDSDFQMENAISHEIGKGNNEADPTTEEPTTTTELPGCVLGNHKFPNGSDILGALCSNEEWQAITYSNWFGTTYCFAKSISSNGLGTFDGSLSMPSKCSYDFFIVDGEMTVSVNYVFNGEIGSIQIQNFGSDPVTCANSAGTWDCGFPILTSLAKVPGQEMLSVRSSDPSLSDFLINWNRVAIYMSGNYAYVEIPGDFDNTKISGLCGNNNGVRPDDFLKRDGTLANDSAEFFTSWMVEGTNCYLK